MNCKTQTEVIHIIKHCLRNKFVRYRPETREMPFHYRLLGKDRMALYSFIQSLNTSFGTSIFEPVAVKLAENHFAEITRQYTLGKNISKGAQETIEKIINDLSCAKTSPNKFSETEKIRKQCQIGPIYELKTVKADLYLRDTDGEEYLFDLKTAKPNASNFKDFKRTLLDWVGIELHQNTKAKIHTIIAIPYNPYAPKPYERWTIKGMLDLKAELMVGKDFWDFLGGAGAYEHILNCFEKAGIELRSEIDEYFLKFRGHQ